MADFIAFVPKPHIFQCGTRECVLIGCDVFRWDGYAWKRDGFEAKWLSPWTAREINLHWLPDRVQSSPWEIEDHYYFRIYIYSSANSWKLVTCGTNYVMSRTQRTGGTPPFEAFC